LSPVLDISNCEKILDIIDEEDVLSILNIVGCADAGMGQFQYNCFTSKGPSIKRSSLKIGPPSPFSAKCPYWLNPPCPWGQFFGTKKCGCPHL